MSVESLEVEKREAWEAYKKVRSYIRPLYFANQGSLPIGECNPKILNNSEHKALARFHGADLEWKRALYGKNKEA